LAQSLLPVLDRDGVTTAAALDVDTLEDRLRQEAAALHSQAAFVPQFCAWARKGRAGACRGAPALRFCE